MLKKSLLIPLLFLLAGCITPCDVYLRNYTGKSIRINAFIPDKEYFKRLPNQVSLYDTASNRSKMQGKYNRKDLVHWTDSSHFYYDLPAYSVIHLEDLTDNFTLGLRLPHVSLTVTDQNLYNGDLSSLAEKFTFKKRFFKQPVYYFDFR